MTVLASIASTSALIGCGRQSRESRAEAEVRTLFATVAAEGRTHNFARICQDEMIGLLRELDYLVGGNCAKDLAAEWAEGVQLSTIGHGTRIVVTGNKATVYDGPSPDSAMRVNGVWQMAELPRNRRFRATGEAQEAMEGVNRGLRAHHMPTLNPETGRIGATGPLPPEPR